MLSTLITLLGGGLGALVRYIPELLKLFQDKSDKAHELNLTQLQLELEKQKAATAQQAAQASLDSQTIIANMEALKTALEGQDKLTGIGWIDGINKLVRPTVTYWFLLLFSLHKIVIAWSAYTHGANLAEVVDLVWQARDDALLSMILTFWFVDRSIQRNNGHIS